jgi:hypothetical protein
MKTLSADTIQRKGFWRGGCYYCKFSSIIDGDTGDSRDDADFVVVVTKISIIYYIIL